MSCTLSKRWEMAFLLLSGIAIVYTLRVNMSVASVAMKEDLNWSETDKGYVLSSFYWGYMVGQVPSSMLAQKYGAKWIFGLSVAIPSLLTTLVPMACRHSLHMAFVIRVLIGLFESASFPCLFHFFPIWIPNAEKTIMIPVVLCGVYVGEILAFGLSGVLASATVTYDGVVYGGWASIFYVFGLLGLLWFPVWMHCAYESPSVHPFITKDEIQLINYGKDGCADSAGRLEFADVSTSKPLLSGAPSATYTSIESGSGDGTTGTAALVHRSNSSISSSSTNNSSSVQSHTPGRPHVTYISGSAVLVSSSLSPRSQGQPGTHRFSKEDIAARTPWRVLFTHPVALALLWSSFGYGWLAFTLLSEMPSYLTDILGFDLGSAGILCVFPYLALFVGTLSFARLFDYLQRERDWKVDRVRKTAMFIAYMGSAAGLVICCYLPDKYAAYTFMILTQLLHGAAMSGISCVWTDIAPIYSSQLNSIGNTVAASAGIFGPIVVAHLVQAWPGVMGWRLVFLLTFALCVSFTAVWFRFIKAEIVPALNTPASLGENSK